MKSYTINLEGKRPSDIEDALQEASRLIREGYLQGYDNNNTGGYSFSSSGQYITIEVICDTCGQIGSRKEFGEGSKKKLQCPDCGGINITNWEETGEQEKTYLQ